MFRWPWNWGECGRLVRAAGLAWAAVLSPGLAQSETFLVTTAADSGPGSLRLAISNANYSAGHDRIRFQVPGSGIHVLWLKSPLPAVTDSVEVAGHLQPGFVDAPLIELNGADAGDLPGLRLFANSVTLRALVLNRFRGGGIHLKRSTNSLLAMLRVGTDAAGSFARPNRQFGILVEDSWNVQIGGPDLTDVNLIAGNAGTGLYLLNGGAHSIQSSCIGTSGTLPLPNQLDGLAVYNSCSNLIGGLRPNIISGNGASGIHLHGPRATGNVLRGNCVGTDISATRAIPNGADGLTVAAPANHVGGTGPGEGNIFSGNLAAGVHLSGTQACYNVLLANRIGTDAFGEAALPNLHSGVTLSGSAHHNYVGNGDFASCNLISGNSQSGCLLSTNSVFNTVYGNVIGANADGTRALPNGFNGVTILQSARSNYIGGPALAPANLLSGNTYHGLEIAPNAVANCVSGNFIGTDATGTKPLPNGFSGLRLAGDHSWVLSNLISGNVQHGIVLTGSGASQNQLQMNLVGVDVSGTKPVPNGGAGVLLHQARANSIGSPIEGRGNLVSANGDAGVHLWFAISNFIIGNTIGADAASAHALPNLREGIFLNGSTGNCISSNIVVGNRTRGLLLTNSSLNDMHANYVGIARDDATVLLNGFHAIEFDAGSTSNRLGAASMNTIACPTLYAAVRVRDLAWGNDILNNSFISLGGLPIDLGPPGLDPNDSCDLDLGANLGQNSPTLQAAVAGDSTRVRGFLDSEPNRPFRLQFFAQIAPGEICPVPPLCNITTGSACLAKFDVTLPALAPGTTLFAAVTDPAQNTSEVSSGLLLAHVPNLHCIREGQVIHLSWPVAEPTCRLLRAHHITPPVQWELVTATSTFLGTNFCSVPITESSSFYRLEARWP